VPASLEPDWESAQLLKTCVDTQCLHSPSYAPAFDAFVCPKCDEWLEPTCPDPGCGFCRRRGKRPSAVAPNPLVTVDARGRTTYSWFARDELRYAVEQSPGLVRRVLAELELEGSGPDEGSSGPDDSPPD
jgi:hypothetical protein